jgi:hypothetical protein
MRTRVFGPVLVLSLALPVLGGCFLMNVQADERLRESVYGLNEEARWGRIDLALERVSPAYQGKFARRRALWGRRIQIADSDMTHLKLDDDKDKATSLVAVSWYDYATMTVHQTLVQQHWKRVDIRYMLTDERVLDGDPALLAVAEREGQRGRRTDREP